MNSEEAAALLPLHRPGRPAESRLQKAIKIVEKDPALAARLATQSEFDSQLVGVIQSIQTPENLRRKLRETSERADAPKAKKSSQALNPVVITAVLGVLIIAGFLVWQVMERMEKFGGRDAAERMLAATSKMSGLELDPASNPTGTMQDYFYMRGFEGYAVPQEVAGLHTVGSRVFPLDGHTIAQLAVDRHDSILFVFRASDFSVDLPQDGPWRVIEYQDWAAALRRHGDLCSMLAFRGTKPEMQEFLKDLKAP